MNHEIDLSYRRIVQLTAPVLIGQLSHTMMGVVDTVMVGRLGVTELAAVGLGNYLTWWLLSFVVGMITGVNTLVAQAIGGDRPRAAGVAFWQGIYLGLMLAAMLAACWPLVPGILRATGATPEAAAIGAEYMQVRMLGGLGFALLMVSDNFYRGIGRTAILMWAGLAQLALNCGLNYMLIFGRLGAPRLGAVGAAWGTVLAGTVIGLALTWSLLGRRRIRLEYALVKARLEGRSLRILVALSLPIAVQFFMEMGGITIFFALVARLGDAEMAATNAVVQAWSVAFMGAYSLSVGSTTLVGQCVGAGRPEDGRLAVRRVLRLGYGLAAIMAAVYLTVPERLMALFVKDADLELLLPFARPLFVVVVLCLFFDTVFHIIYGALRGAGDTKYPMVVNIGSAWLLFVPATLLVTPIYGLIGAWSCLIVHIVVMASLLALRFRGKAWMRPPLEQDAAPRDPERDTEVGGLEAA